MGTGIGKDCKICGDQLNDDAGYSDNEELCLECEQIIPKVLKYLTEK